MLKNIKKTLIFIIKTMNSLRSAIRNILLESINPNDSFSTKIDDKNVDFNYLLESELGHHYNLEGKEEFQKRTNLFVDWDFNVDARENFIKSIDLTITNIRGIIVVIPDPEDSFHDVPYSKQKSVGEEISIPFDANKLQFQIENEIKLFNGKAIFPKEISIDFKSKTIRVL